MEKFIIEDLSEIAEVMYLDVTVGGYGDAVFVGYYEDAITVLKHLFMFEEPMPFHINIEDVDWDGYNKEYLVTLDSKMNVWCEKAYDYEHNRYLVTEAGCAYVADNCNASLLKCINCCEDELYEVSYDLDDDESDCECDGKCECCNCNQDKKNHDDAHEEITRVATDDSGKLRGFEKSWETHEDGLHYHSTYSFFSSNEDMLKNMMKNFSIKY